MMQHPTEEQARDFLRTLPYDAWLYAALMMPPKLIQKRSVKTLDDLELLLRPASNAIASVDLPLMCNWIEEKVGDVALAAQIRQEVLTINGYKQQCQKAHEVLLLRIGALKKAAGVSDV